MNNQISKQCCTHVSSPIEKRSNAKGRPNAVLLLNVNLSKRQLKLLEKLESFDSRVIVKKNSVSLKDLSALTAKTGCEFAMFTKGGTRLIIRGNDHMVNIHPADATKLANHGYRWSGHTHPGITTFCLVASSGDYDILGAFKQERSVVYNSNGQHQLFHVDN